MAYNFRWDQWNRHKVAMHNVEPEEAGYVVRNAQRPYPRQVGHGKYLLWGQTDAGAYLQVIFVKRDAEILVIHARALTAKEVRPWRRRKKR
ncbi:MAG TPA: BrnT family toxin [Phycisphaerae bacterium]